MSALDFSASPQSWAPAVASWPCPWKQNTIVAAGRCAEMRGQCCGCPRGEQAPAAVVTLPPDAIGTRQTVCTECPTIITRKAMGRRAYVCSPRCKYARIRRLNAAGNRLVEREQRGERCDCGRPATVLRSRNSAVCTRCADLERHTDDPDIVAALRAGERPAEEIASDFGVDTRTVQRIRARMRGVA